MNESLKQTIRRVVPAWILDPVIERHFRVRWGGNFSTWTDARAASRGYDAADILERVVGATRRVREGEAAYERDGVAFGRPTPDRLVVETLTRAARCKGGPVSVLDFGGSLGSVYWQNRRAWDADVVRRWCVVEQPHFVAAGKREFENEQLAFFSTVEDVWAMERPDVLLLSGVLQYLEAPHVRLEELLRKSFRTVAILRMGFVEGSVDRLTVQKVPRSIYGGSYPCWFFSRERMLAHFGGYTLAAEVAGDEGACDGVEFKHLVWERTP